MIRKRTSTITLCFLAIGLLAGGVSGHAAAPGQSLNFATNPAGNENYTIAVSQGQLISKKTNIQVIVQPTQGPKVLPSLMESNDAQLSNLSSMGTYWALTGTGEYDKPFKFIRVLQSGNDKCFGFITREKSGIKKISDLKGKKITYIFTSLLTKEVAEMELQAFGLNPAKDVTMLKAEDGSRALQDLGQGRTDAVSATLGGSKMAELASKTKIVVLPFPADKVPFLQKRLPAMLPALTPNNLTGIDPGVPMVASTMLFIGRADLGEDAVYTMVKALIENYNELKVINPVLADWKPEVAVQEVPVPYHPGAIKYYREKGLWSSKMDQLQQTLIGR